jgi:hypothetical protein
MVEIAEEVRREWEILREQDEPVVLLRFIPVGDLGEAARAIREAVTQVTDSFGARLDASDDMDSSWTGEWSWLRVADGVLVNMIESEFFDEILLEVAQALERRGIEGTFRLWHEYTDITHPSIAHHVECRISVRGKRVHHELRGYRWQPDADAQAAVLFAADQWCRRQPGTATCSIRKDTFGWVPVSACEVLADRMIEAVGDDMGITVSCMAGDEFRGVGARSYVRGVSLVAGGPSIDDGAWRTALAEFTDLLRQLADCVAYAYIKRGWAANQALEADDSLLYDWPSRPDYAPRGIGFTAQAFEDVYAPDAFGVQLLGPGYADRVPTSPSWRKERAGRAAVVLEHDDLPAWFDTPFVPYDARLVPEQRPQPPVLTAARTELAPLLYTPGVLHRNGYADEAEL